MISPKVNARIVMHPLCLVNWRGLCYNMVSQQSMGFRIDVDGRVCHA